MADRRQFLSYLGAGSAAVGSLLSPSRALAAHQLDTGASAAKRFRYCLNMSTVRGHGLSVPEQIDLAADAGYDAIEPWVRDLRQYVETGGRLRDIRQQLEDRGLTVESAIGFAQWIVDDPGRRQMGLEEARRDMELLAEIGAVRIAAPPAGATKEPGLDLNAAAERYAVLLALGHELGVIPQLELWGFSANLSKLGELAYVAIESGHPGACILPDVYHIYKGGSDFTGLGMLNGGRIHVFHINDYPADPPRESIGDRDRVYPGDGVAPLADILLQCHAAGFKGVLSLELFNPEYWKRPAAEVAETGLRKMQAAVSAAGL